MFGRGPNAILILTLGVSINPMHIAALHAFMSSYLCNNNILHSKAAFM